MQKKTRTEVAAATSFLDKQWRYTGQWTSDGGMYAVLAAVALADIHHRT